MNGSVLSFNGSYNTIMILITTVITLEELLTLLYLLFHSSLTQ